MRTLTVRTMPDSVYAQLADWAKENRRSLQEQARHLLEMDVRLRGTSVMEEAAAYRARFSGRNLGNVVEDVRLFTADVRLARSAAGLGLS